MGHVDRSNNDALHYFQTTLNSVSKPRLTLAARARATTVEEIAKYKRGDVQIRFVALFVEPQCVVNRNGASAALVFSGQHAPPNTQDAIIIPENGRLDRRLTKMREDRVNNRGRVRAK